MGKVKIIKKDFAAFIALFFVFALVVLLGTAQEVFAQKGGVEGVLEVGVQKVNLKTLSSGRAVAVENEVIVKFKAGQTPQNLQAAASKRKAMGLASRAFDTLKLYAKGKKPPEQLLEKLSEKEESLNISEKKELFNNFEVAKSDDKSVSSLVEEYKKLDNVEIAEPNYIYYSLRSPNDPFYNGRWVTFDDGSRMFWEQWNYKELGLAQVWDTTVGKDNVIVAVLDTGVGSGGDPLFNDYAFTYKDLEGKLVEGYDFINNDNFATDDDSHGSHVASIIGAVTNNSEGVAGVNWKVKIMPIKVLDPITGGTTLQIAAGINWARNHGADIINMSLGAAGEDAFSQYLKSAIDDAFNSGILVVAAAGNEFEKGNPIIYPAAYPNVIAVGAVDDQNKHASYSTTGSYLDIAAYGGDPTGGNDNATRHWIAGVRWYYDGFSINYGYTLMAGTSQAAPHVSGLAALMLSVNDNLRNINDQRRSQALRDLITSTAIDLGSVGRDDFFGAGLINPAGAVAAAESWGQATPTPTPTPTLTLTPTPTPPASCGADIDCSGEVGRADILSWRDLLRIENPDRADIDKNSRINIVDYLRVFAFWLK